MRIGYGHLFTGEPDSGVGLVRDLAVAIEELGFRSLWAGEHYVLWPGSTKEYPNGAMAQRDLQQIRGVMDPPLMLATAASVTSTLRLGTGITLLCLRNPLIFAREAATLDQLSGGRLNIGVGVGWLKEEYEILGVPWERRGARLDEYIDVLRTLWTTELSSFEGEFVNFNEIWSYPKPLQSPYPPFYIGGNGPPAARRIARHDGSGWYGSNLTTSEIAEFLDVLDTELSEVGRERSDVDLIVAHRTASDGPAGWHDDRQFVDECRALGIDEVVLRPRIGADIVRQTETYAGVIGLSAINQSKGDSP